MKYSLIEEQLTPAPPVQWEQLANTCTPPPSSHTMRNNTSAQKERAPYQQQSVPSQRPAAMHVWHCSSRCTGSALLLLQKICKLILRHTLSHAISSMHILLLVNKQEATSLQVAAKPTVETISVRSIHPAKPHSCLQGCCQHLLHMYCGRSALHAMRPIWHITGTKASSTPTPLTDKCLCDDLVNQSSRKRWCPQLPGWTGQRTGA